MSGATFADATNVTITATGANLIINDSQQLILQLWMRLLAIR